MENNKKVGILTFHTADNYGAVLQAYALQHYIEQNITREVEIINYETEDHIKAYKIFNTNNKKWYINFVFNFLRAMHYFELKRKKERFAKFRKDYFRLTKETYRSEEELKCIKGKDIYISGSDQVFNPRLEDYKAYFLNFEKGESKKVAYAASFGISKFSDEITAKIKPFLDDFDALSCREQSGAAYLSKIMHLLVDTVVDPTFLLSKEDWNEIVVRPKEEKYLFVYNLNGGKRLMSIAEKVAQQEGLNIIQLGGVMCKGGIVKRDLGPKEFVGYIMHADFVVTDSFHGTAFSLICQKRHLSYIALKDKGARIETIMKAFGKENEIIYDAASFNYDSNTIKPVMEVPHNLLSKSVDYLRNNL